MACSILKDSLAPWYWQQLQLLPALKESVLLCCTHAGSGSSAQGFCQSWRRLWLLAQPLVGSGEELSDVCAPPRHLMLQPEGPNCQEGLTLTVAAASPAFVPAVDHSRVELSLITSDADSHYINANFIKVLLPSLPFAVQWCLQQLLELPG